MAYIKQLFKKDQVLEAEHLNHIEDGIASLAQNNVIDLIIFMGQSNMAGRGVTSTAHPEKAPTVPEGHGYEFRAISDPTKLYNIIEPFGVNENNKTSGINETNKTGSMVAAFANAYYSYTGIPIVGISCSKGGSNIGQWQPNGPFLNDAISRYKTAKKWLTNNGYTIRRQFMVWCQGESDAKLGTSQEDYINKTKLMVEAMMKQGIEKCLMVRIGQYVGDTNFHTDMIRLQTEMCKTYENLILISTDFASLVKLGLMKDEQHYLQKGYNITGTNAGKHAAFYVNNGVEPYMYDFEYNNTYIPYSLSMGSSDISSDEIIKIEERLSLLEEAIGIVKYSVSYNLTNIATSSNKTQAIQGKPYTNTLSGSGYYIVKDVSVTMGGIDITTSCYNDGVITIENVTGDIVITANGIYDLTSEGVMLNLDFTQKSLNDYISEGLLSKNGTISTSHTAEGDKFVVAADASNIKLTSPLDLPDNFEIHLRLKTSNDIATNAGTGLPLFTANNNRPWIFLRAPYDGCSYINSYGLQSRLITSGGDTITIDDVTIPRGDNIFHDVIIHYEGETLWMSVDGAKSAVASSSRDSDVVTHMFGYSENYNMNNATVAYLRVLKL